MKKMKNVSFQLYSARFNNSWTEVISLLSELGYNQVEGFDSNFDKPHEFRSILDKYNMSMPSGHFYPLSSLEQNFEASLSISKVLGIERIFCAAPDDHLCNSNDHIEWIKFAQRLNNVCKKLNEKEEYLKRREFAVNQGASKKTLRILDELSESYENNFF